jgi:hypothetical protein
VIVLENATEEVDAGKVSIHFENLTKVRRKILLSVFNISRLNSSLIVSESTK